MNQADAPVFRKILVAFDGSPGAWSALRHAILLAAEHGAALIVLSVEEPVPHYASVRDQVRQEEEEVTSYFERLQADARREAEALGVPITTEIVHGHAARAIVDYARQVGADLIVMGQHGHSGMLEHFLGSTSDRVIDLAPSSVLVVRGA
jgi:nucleotide-binding universal stress UspA family protein